MKKQKFIILELKLLFLFIFLAYVSVPFFILNLNTENGKTFQLKLNKEKLGFFQIINNKRNLGEKIQSKRELSDNDELSNDNSEKFCSGASKKLKQYYITGDSSKLGIDNDPINPPDRDNFIGPKLAEISNYLFGSYDQYNSEEDKEDPIYLTFDIEYSFLLKIFFGFLFIGYFCYVLSIVNVCCKCRWCCECCKKSDSKCIKPCFVLAYFCFFVIIISSLYGLIKSIQIIKGVANTQCSSLKFFETILNGEQKETRSKWLGIEGTKKILQNLYSSSYDDYNYEYSYLTSRINNTENEKDNFQSKLKSVHKKFYKEDEITPLEGYSKDYPDNNEYYINNGNTKFYLRNKYVLDLLSIFGKYHTKNDSFSGLISSWNEEFSSNDKELKKAMDEIQNCFKDLANSKLKYHAYDLNILITRLEKLENPLKKIYRKKLKSSDKFRQKFSSKIMKLVSILFFLLTFFLSILLAILLQCLYKNYCQNRCKLLAGIHITWNLLGLLMIVSLLGANHFTYIGQYYGDMAPALSYIVGEANFNTLFGGEIINNFEEGKDIFEEAFIGEGDLLKAFNLGYLKDFLIKLIKPKKKIDEHVEKFKNLNRNFTAYYNLKSLLENKTEFINDTEIYHYNSNTNSNDEIQKVNLDEVLKLLNDSISNNNKEKWNIFQGDKDYECINGNKESETPKNNLLHPWTCEPIDRDWVESSNNDIKNYAKISSDIIDLLKYANGTKNPGMVGFQSYYDVLDQLKKMNMKNI